MAIENVTAVRAELLRGLVAVDTVADALGASQKTIGRLIARKQLPTVKIVRKRYVVLEQAREALLGDTSA